MDIADAPLIPSPSVNIRNLVLVTETWPPEINGVAMTLQRLIHGLLVRGWQVQVVRPRQKNEVLAINSGIEHILVPGLPIPGYAGLRFGMPMLQKLRAAWKKQRPHVVHIATEGPLGWAALKVARSLGIPVTSSFHTNFHRYCKHYRIGWLRGLVSKHLRDFHNESALTMVPNATLSHALLEDDYRNVVVLGRGVDSGLFSPDQRCNELRAEWGLDNNDLAVIYVGRIAAEKNLHLVIKGFEVIQRCKPSARMIWVGSGPELKKLQKQHPEHIFCGPHLGESLARHYASADLFLFPSMTETFGNVVTEAMASGLAVVAYDYAAAEMFIRNEENGLLIPFGDQAKFIEASASLAANGKRIRQLGMAASATVNGHSWDKVFNQFDSYLRQVSVA
ncbi:MAG TPA: glycosyltransferase family 1 protein [Methylophilaceae bacterium]|jgi:glycosyltransferase involved in cell wall biosynthesis